MPFDESTVDDSTIVSCPQNKFRLDFIMGEGERIIQNEDCHFLSICTPSREGNRPVLVWIHGGAYIAGCGEESAYDGTALAEEGDIVVVSITYRLGIFGYLYNPEGEPRNLGLKDQMTALRWVHENISRFGGDPDRVTIAGQSAGGHSVASLISCCKEPYFRKAIIQSAPLDFQFGEQYLKKQYRDFLNPAETVLVYSQYKGYLNDQPKLQEFVKMFECNVEYVHTSGHATRKTLAKICTIVNPKSAIVPIHKASDGDLRTLDISDELKNKVVDSTAIVNEIRIQID